MTTKPEYLKWGPKRVYILMAITRPGENEDITDNSKLVRRLVVRHEDEFEESLRELRHWCAGDLRTYRIYLSVNARNTFTALFKFRKELDEWLSMHMNGNETVTKKFKGLDSEFKSILQKEECRDDRYFLFDLDDVNEDYVERFVETCPVKVYHTTETPNGYHVVTEPFNVSSLQDSTELKKDGMLHLEKL